MRWLISSVSCILIHFIDPPGLPRVNLVRGLLKVFSGLLRGDAQRVVVADPIVGTAGEGGRAGPPSLAAVLKDLLHRVGDFCLPTLKLLGRPLSIDAGERGVVDLGGDADGVGEGGEDVLAGLALGGSHVPSELTAELERRVEDLTEPGGTLVVYGKDLAVLL